MKLEFKIVHIVPSASPPNLFYFRRDYLVDSLERAGATGTGCTMFWVKCTSAAALVQLQREIDALFANTPDETRSQDENAFIMGFIRAVGDIPSLAESMAVVVVIIITLVAGNTMMMSFRERSSELAIFKALGFQARRVFGLVVAESVLLAGLGSSLGIVLGLLSFGPLQGLAGGEMDPPKPSGWAVLLSLAIGLLVGLVAGLWPAYQALRLRATDALRRVE
jgi:putative ABC transport system permease protein